MGPTELRRTLQSAVVAAPLAVLEAGIEEIHGEEKLGMVREVVRAYPGNCELHLVLRLVDGSRVLMKSNRLRVEINEELRARINELLGEGNFQLMTAKPTPAPPRPKGRRSTVQAK